MSKSTKAPAPTSIADFEKTLQELENLVNQMEQGQMTLEQLLNAYEHGVALYNQCQSALEQAQLRVQHVNDPMQAGKSTPTASAQQATIKTTARSPSAAKTAPAAADLAGNWDDENIPF